MLVSICAIAFNEGEAIGKFVEQTKKWADEIIIVDNNSTDDTAKIAEQAGCVVVRNNLNALDSSRSLYLQRAKGNWILTLDLDEEMFDSDFKAIRDTLEKADESMGGFYLPIQHYFGKGHWATTYHCRIYRSINGMSYSRRIHGSVYKHLLERGYTLGVIDAPIHHYDAIMGEKRNLSKRRRNTQLISSQLEEAPSASLYCYLAQEQSALNLYEDALESATKAIDLDTDQHTFGHLCKAQILVCLGRYTEAILYADKQKQICESKKGDPREKYFQRIADLCNFVWIQHYLNLNKKEEALKILEKSIQDYPRLAHNYLNHYIISGSSGMRDMAYKTNPNLKNPNLFCEISPFHLYGTQNSVLWNSDVLNEFERNAK